MSLSRQSLIMDVITTGGADSDMVALTNPAVADYQATHDCQNFHPDTSNTNEDVEEGSDLAIKAKKADAIKAMKAMKAAAQPVRVHLRVFFHPAFKLTGTHCTISSLHCLLFIVHVIKLGLITAQMLSVGRDREHFSSIVNRGQTTLRHLLLEGWDASWETPPYPPAHGEFAVYDVEDIVKKINYAVERYYNLENIAIGTYYRMNKTDNMMIAMQWFNFDACDKCRHKGYNINMEEKTFPVDKGLTSHKDNATNETIYTYDVMKEFENMNISVPIKGLLLLTLKFSIHSVRFFEHEKKALCLSIVGKVTFNDLDNNGQVIMELNTISSKIKCSKMELNITDWSLQRASVGLAKAVITFCCIGLVSALIVFAYAVFVFTGVRKFMKSYYRAYYNDPDGTDLPAGEYFRFVTASFWDIGIVAADILTLYGTSEIASESDRRKIDLDALDKFIISLAIGCFFAWINLLRFVKFHEKFLLLFKTVSRAILDVLAYLVCVALLYLSFLFVGYVVLGPFNVKFSTISNTFETLLALMGGDEIYATFGVMETGSAAIWWFARFYLWAYIGAFIVVVFNLLVAIFMSAYEAVKDVQEHKEAGRDFGPVETALRQFLNISKQSSFWTSLHGLLSCSERFNSAGEQALQKKLSRLCRVSATGDDVILERPRTLKAFMEDEDDAEEFKRCFSCICPCFRRRLGNQHQSYTEFA